MLLGPASRQPRSAQPCADGMSLSTRCAQGRAGRYRCTCRRALHHFCWDIAARQLSAPGGWQGKEVEDGDTFNFNQAFHAPLFRIKINSIQMKETAEENAKTNSQVMQDRQYQVSSPLERLQAADRAVRRGTTWV